MRAIIASTRSSAARASPAPSRPRTPRRCRFLRAASGGDPLWDVDAVEGRAADLGPAPGAPLDARAALRALPPLIKGYWRLGAKFGPQAVVDADFGATDVFAVMPVAEIEPRYLEYFAPDRAAPLAA